jgi:hypothetical protein
MRPVVVVMFVGSLVLGICSAQALADGGVMRLSEEKCGYRITVFSAPTSFRAGPVDISVLVQHASTGDPVTQVTLTVRMTKPGRRALEYPATTDAATNKLFRSAQFELPDAGRWLMQVLVESSDRRAVVTCEVDAAEHLPRWLEMWPWFAWPGLAILVFGIHQYFRGISLSRRARFASCDHASSVTPVDIKTPVDLVPRL